MSSYDYTVRDDIMAHLVQEYHDMSGRELSLLLLSISIDIMLSEAGAIDGSNQITIVATKDQAEDLRGAFIMAVNAYFNLLVGSGVEVSSHAVH